MGMYRRLRLMAEAWLEDLFGETPGGSAPPWGDDLARLLWQGQGTLNALTAALAEASASAARLEAGWLETTAQAQALEASLDVDRRAGLTGAASAKAARLSALKDWAGRAAEQAAAGRRVEARLRTAVEALQLRLDDIRRQRLALSQRQQMVELLVNLDRLDRELGQGSQLLNEGLQARRQAVERLEDEAAAREEWKRYDTQS